MTDSEREKTSIALRNLAFAYGMVDRACVRYGMHEINGADVPARRVADDFIQVRAALDAAREPILAMVSGDIVRLNQTVDRVQQELAHGR